MSPVPNSPADKAGMRSGDIILKINDRDLTLQPMTADEASRAVARHDLHYRHVDAPSHRRRYPHNTDADPRDLFSPYGRLENAPRHLDRLYQGHARDRRDRERVRQSARHAEIAEDDGSGGRPEKQSGRTVPRPVLDIAGQFLKNSEVVVYEKYRDGTEKSYNAGNGRGATDLPVTVLVNSGTASVAEFWPAR